MRHERLSQDFGKHSMLVLVLLLMASALVALSPTAPWAGLNVDAHAAGLANPAALEPHAPIHITSDDGFNTSNGVRGGTGTAAAPYLISDWLVDAALYPNSSAMIWLENTDRHVVVQNCQVIHLDTVGEQFQAFYVGKYPGENMTPIIGPPTIDLTSNVTFVDNDIERRYGYGIQIAEGSSNILAKGNHVAVHPDNVSGRDWIYGINVARGTHNVTIEDNVVNAGSSLYITIGIHLSDYYVSEQRRASRLVARNNTVIDAAGGIHVESSRFTLVQDNTIYRTNLNSLAYGWPRAITVRESALNASLVHNTIRVELTGIIIGASTGRWDTYGSVTSANNTTIRDNVISNVTSGIQIGNVSGTQVIDTTFANVGLQELNLNGEGGAPRNLTLTDLAFPVRIRAPAEAIPIHWSWTHLTPSAEYNLSATNGTTTVNASFATTAAGVGFVDVEQPRTNATNLTVYRLAGPLPPPNAPPTADFVWAPTLGNTSTMFVFTAQASDDHDLHVPGAGERRSRSTERHSGPVGLERRWDLGHALVDHEDRHAHVQRSGRLHGGGASNRLGRPYHEQVAPGFSNRPPTAAEQDEPGLHANADTPSPRERFDPDHDRDCHWRNRLCGESRATQTGPPRLSQPEVATVALTSSS